ncbi:MULTISPECIES: FAD-dependent monooxygenase [unclassified Streptomyces]|uniref:FAD-dependent monooxygenase n=1 Tax=unclassified Streptomyces TaxID=2593676 RepID=UPI003429EE68
MSKYSAGNGGTTRKHVLISGASIAGNALAHCLNQYGFEVTVVERWGGLRPGGQAVDLRGVAKEAVRRMGIEEQVRAARTETDGASFVTRAGRRVATLRADQFDGDGLIAETEILRGDLAQVFHDAAKDSTEYLFGDRITALHEDPDGVTVRFAGGDERRFDLVVGADGQHSGTRSLVFGAEERFRRHLDHFVSFFTVPNHLGLDRWMQVYSEPGRTVAIRSIHDNRAAMAFLTLRSPEFAYDHQDLDAQKALVRERFADAGWETPWLLDRLATAPDFFFDAAAQIHLPHWWHGRVALVGDAAYGPSSLSGQGTSVAVVGAYVLAGELAAAAGDHTSAFPAYQERLQAYVRRNQAVGESFERTSTARGRLGVVMQYAAIAALPYLPFRTFGEMRRAVNDLALPDYRHLVRAA